ncbi:MAG: sigma-70 family RNA polymerase sigma factor [bacterium]|nr:sigma-70 family RNA polymerase sigma factor [bacterium]
MSGSFSTEEPLVARAQAGEIEAFEELYQIHIGRVYGLCVRMCGGDRAVAEELAQEAFIRAWQKLGSFEGRSAFGTWLHRLTANVVLGHLRRQQSWFERSGQSLEELVTGPATRAGTSELALDLEKAIAGLPPRARTVFVLHDVEGFRHHEISQLADMAVGTSKAQLHRARKLLREVLT